MDKESTLQEKISDKFPEMGINIEMWLDEQDPKNPDYRVVRYLQIGYENEKGEFTGYMVDYTGGGTFSDYYAIDDIYHSGGCFEVHCKDGFEVEMYRILDSYAVDVDGVRRLIATDYLMNKLKLVPSDKLFSEGADITPILVGNTCFPKQLSDKSCPVDCEC